MLRDVIIAIALLAFAVAAIGALSSRLEGGPDCVVFHATELTCTAR